MKPNYENWMPKGMVIAMLVVAIVLLLGGIPELIFYIMKGMTHLIFIPILLLVMSAVFFVIYFKFKFMRRAFDFNEKSSIGWKIINYVTENIKTKDDAKILDVGCGSGALAIDCAKKYPSAQVTGLDKWGGSYKKFTKELCESNAKAENVGNVEFVQGSAVSLPFEDESFDVVTSNFVYHNIPGNRQNYILETLRVLKKGGTFVIHDLFTKQKYGNLDKLVEKLKNDGYEKIDFLDSCDGKPLTRDEAKKTLLSGSKLMIGIK